MYMKNIMELIIHLKRIKKNNDVRSSINKTFNLSKYKNNKLLEDDIFKLLIDSIEKN